MNFCILTPAVCPAVLKQVICLTVLGKDICLTILFFNKGSALRFKINPELLPEYSDLKITCNSINRNVVELSDAKFESFDSDGEYKHEVFVSIEGKESTDRHFAYKKDLIGRKAWEVQKASLEQENLVKASKNSKTRKAKKRKRKVTLLFRLV